MVGQLYLLKIGKKGKELNGCHWPKTWSSDASATTVALLSKRRKMQMLNGVPPEYVTDV